MIIVVALISTHTSLVLLDKMVFKEPTDPTAAFTRSYSNEKNTISISQFLILHGSSRLYILQASSVLILKFLSPYGCNA